MVFSFVHFICVSFVCWFALRVVIWVVLHGQWFNAGLVGFGLVCDCELCWLMWVLLVFYCWLVACACCFFGSLLC